MFNFKFTSGQLVITCLNQEDIQGEPFAEIIGDTLHITLKLKDDSPRICTKCGSTNVVIKETRKVNLKDNGSVSFFDSSNSLITKVIIHVCKRKYLCKDCGTTFMQSSPFSDSNRRISNALAWRIHDMFHERISFTEIARKADVSIKTVVNIFDRTVTIGRQPLTSIICIDEFYFKVSKQNKFPAVISSFEQRRILDIVKSRKKEYLIDYFLNIPTSELESVKVFISDMNDTYREMRKLFFSKAIHVVDRFHVVKLFTTKINVVRSFIYKKNYLIPLFYRNFLKKKWKLFLLKKDKIPDKIIFNKVSGYNESLGDILIKILSYDEGLKDIYDMYQRFLELRIDTDKEEASKKIDEIIRILSYSVSSQAKEIAGSLTKWKEEIIAYYSNPNRKKLSNSIAEAINSEIRKTLLVGYGMTNFERMKKRVMYIDNYRFQLSRLKKTK